MLIYQPTISGSSVLSGSVIITGSLNVSSGITGSLFGTSSWAQSSSQALTASFAPNYVLNSATSSFVLNSQTGSFTTTSSFNSFTSSYINDSSSFNTRITNLTNATSSYVLNSQTGSFATTGSNAFKASQVITGSLTITNDLIVFGSASITTISQSTLNIGTNLITVNTNTPSVRFGGLAVIDSGSSPQQSGSILFDSTNNQWIFVHQASSGQVTSSVFIQGPQTFNSLGNETTLTTNRVPKAVGGDLGEHIGDSNITDTGTVVSINSNTEITGSLRFLNGGVTSSLFGTSSWAQSSSQALTASFLPIGTYNITSSWAQSASQALTASFLPIGTYTITSSWAQSSSQALTASFVTGSIFTSTNPALSSSFALTASYALSGVGGTPITFVNANPGGGSYSNLATLYVSGSGVTISNPSAGIVSMSIAGVPAGSGTTFAAGNVDNRLITATGNSPGELNGEANLTFDGSALILSGSLTVFTGSVVELQVTDTGVKIGNIITDIHTVTGSLNISGSLLVNGSAPGGGITAEEAIAYSLIFG